MANIADVTEATFEATVLGAQLPVLVDFWADWCGPCKAAAPMLEDLAREYDGEADIVKVDVVANPELAKRYSAGSIPLFLIFKDGEPVERIVGASSRSNLAAAIDRTLEFAQ